MTAVEYLLEKWAIQGTLHSSDIAQAKEMEKEQIMKTAIQSYNNCILLLDKSGDEYIEYAKQCYDETFKSE